MAKRPTLKLSRGGSKAHGSRPSRRSATRTRGSGRPATLRAGGRTGSRAGPRTRQDALAHAVLVHVAMKRALRKGALRDCGQRCVYCATPLDQHSATLDHVVPLARGGAHDSGNVVAACGPCNRLKGDLLPFEFFARHPWAGANFVRYARNVHRALKRGARRAVSLAFAREDDAVAA
jgi:5-methylcytosine-specific restriction endonuclease McrA